MVCNCETFRAYINCFYILVNDSKKTMDSLVNLSTTVKSLCCYAYHHHDTSQVSHYNLGITVRCINLYDVRLLIISSVCDAIWGIARGRGILLVLIIPGWDRGS